MANSEWRAANDDNSLFADLPICNSIYGAYAHVYDRSGQIGFALRMLPYLDQVLERHGFIGDTMLDLCCGTGTLALSFAGRGWKVYGLDRSSAMLEEAQRKEQELDMEGAVTWVQADARDFTLPESVDLVTCTYDSLNYLLTPEDLRRAFRCVQQVLRPGGLFVFDMNTPWTFEHNWNNRTYFVEDDDLALIIQSAYDPARKQVTALITGFVRQRELYERFQEVHIERGYEQEEIVAALEESGFTVSACYHCFSFDPPGPECPRILWVARRKG